MLRNLLCHAAAATLLLGAPPPALPPNLTSALNGIKAANLKGDLSFLASDALGGRYTPSPGLDAAAEFIAGQFRAIGLQPAGDHDYFQTAHLIDRKPISLPEDLRFTVAGESKSVAAASTAVLQAPHAVDWSNAPVLVLPNPDPSLLKAANVQGRVIVTAPSRGLRLRPQILEFRAAAAAKGALGELLVQNAAYGRRPRLLDASDVANEHYPVVLAESKDLSDWLAHPDRAGTITASIPAIQDHPVVARNVVGILPGSDPKLKNTYVLLTAHYDHIGTLETGRRMSPQKIDETNHDQIFNGANDDGSGTVSVIEVARALATLRPRPRRTLVFMTFFGEERGDIGSGYYGAHPVFPIAQTVADLNLEQVGRTDATNGKQVNNASVTGFDYSSVVAYLQRAGRRTGIDVYLDKDGSDAFFERSDNAALAIQGVPAHTLCVAFEYPDYHGLGDDWTKIDYDNMAKVDRAVALALVNIANAAKPPEWNSANPKTEAFRQARAQARPPNGT